MFDPVSLRSTAVSRCLEKKLLFFGFELPDVLIIFIFLSALNLAFGRTHYRVVLVWVPALALAGALRGAKRGKPDDFLIHWARFHIGPRALYAFYQPTVRINTRGKLILEVKL
ncbi:hypothetical protein WDW37_20770 [Bdellovibrionota bacterium FG-1]